MNYDQMMGIVRAIVPPALAYVVGKGWLPAGAVGDVTAAVTAVAAALWSATVHTDSAKIAAVEALPDVAKVIAVPRPDPAGAVAEAVANNDRPKVVAATATSAQRA